ncbi:Crp/Fnr family transcriptional regulator [Winogradskyella sp. A3E31]|uniref:Crp/Fnr family transcriptional regulator n=1 Tax=Winogradskyella sp. A3E31 TaxID=3349637 RepID=UPI00398B1D0C
MVSTESLSQFQNIFNSGLLQKIQEAAFLKEFEKGSIIIDINQDLKYVPLLISGNIKVLREDNNDHEIILYILEKGDTCAMSLTCCIDKSKSKIRAIADTDTEVVMVPLENMLLWFNSEPDWRQFILQSYQIRFDEMLQTIDTLAFMNMDERLFKYLTNRVKLSGDPELNITHQQIAEDLNTSRVVVSRLLKQLENNNKITLSRNKVEVLT